MINTVAKHFKLPSQNHNSIYLVKIVERNIDKKSTCASQPAISPCLNRLAKPFASLDEVDKMLLQLLQDDFPIVERPWQVVSTRLGVTEEEVLLRLTRLQETGILRKIGAIIDSSKIGLTAATLVAMKVPKNNVEKVARIINQYDNVSHNYERDHNYNVWFTVSALNLQQIENIMAEISHKTGIAPNDILSFPTVHRFKVNVQFQLT